MKTLTKLTNLIMTRLGQWTSLARQQIVYSVVVGSMLVTYILYSKIIETKQDEYSLLVWAVRIEVSQPHHTISHGLQQYPRQLVNEYHNPEFLK